uniref:SNF2 N-terminal domain-containing protein n=1 Tax=Romanomermis culicivorax TaxID=13658 RepID=A0A915K295_ROMCU
DQFVEHLNSKIKLSVYQYYGTNRTTLESLRRKDIVITTYGTLSSCYKKRLDPLFQIDWLRIVLDEAHMIRNPNSRMAHACCALRADRRWVLT